MYETSLFLFILKNWENRVFEYIHLLLFHTPKNRRSLFGCMEYSILVLMQLFYVSHNTTLQDRNQASKEELHLALKLEVRHQMLLL
jgi:hypothetical protein